jgi:long-chain acyl-CoA synthetase
MGHFPAAGPNPLPGRADFGGSMDSPALAHPWLKHYPPEVDWAAPLTGKPVFALLEESAARYPDNDCIDFQDRRFTYAEV